MDISVVIGSFNQKNRLKRVMDGYMGQETSISFEVVVVDSMSTDGTAEMMSEFGGLDAPFALKFIQRQNPYLEKRRQGMLGCQMWLEPSLSLRMRI